MRLIVLVVGFMVTTLILTHMHRSDISDSVVLVMNGNGHGSGVIVGPNMVLTAKHVAEHEDLRVITADGVERPITRVRLDPDSDAALLYVDKAFGVRALPINSTPLRVGDAIRVIGTPPDIGCANCVLPGTVVRVGLDVLGGWSNLAVTDAHAMPGCSGGPVIDGEGRVRAIHVAGLGGALAGELPAAEFKGDLGL